MRRELREGLTLTRCDVCNVRRFCAVNGTAMCEQCCPGAVADAREQAADRRMDRQAVRDAQWMAEHLPPEEGAPLADPIPFRDVAHIICPEWYAVA
jgi:hypothetical protein